LIKDEENMINQVEVTKEKSEEIVSRKRYWRRTRRKEEEDKTHPSFFSTQRPIILFQHPINPLRSKTSSYSLVHSRENDSVESVKFFESDWRGRVFG